MNKLAAAIDTRNKALPVAQPSSYVNYYTAAASGESIPEGSRFVEVMALSTEVWYAFGGSTVTCTAPVNNVTDGTAPSCVLGGSAALFELRPGDTHFSIDTTGEALVSFWA